MDDKTTVSPDAEYKFTGSDEAPTDIAGSASPATGEEAPASTPPSGFMGNINGRRFIMPGAIVLAIFLVYGFFNFYNNRNARAAEQQKMQVQEAAAKQQEVISAPAVKEVVVQPEPSFLNNEQVTQVQAAVQQKISAVEQEISSNRDQLSSLKDAVSKAQQDISSIGQNIEQLTGVTQQFLVEIQQLKAPKIKPKKKAVKPLPIYHIRAIVPGRVWLESADGNSVTLRVGNTLEGYGTVDVISPRQGMVLMSNGSYIQYGVNDF
jgi:hypothetical protein